VKRRLLARRARERHYARWSRLETARPAAQRGL